MKILNYFTPLQLCRTNSNLSLFKNITIKKTNIRNNSLWRLLTPQTMNFKSFFVFLRTKPFIIKMRYNLLTNFIMNPRPHTLSTFISLTKQFKAAAIHSYFTFKTSSTFISKRHFHHLIYKCNNKTKKKIFFNLFKYKLFKYTTSPKLKVLNESFVSHFANLDFRTSLVSSTLKRSFPNVNTVSTYNWKIIN